MDEMRAELARAVKAIDRVCEFLYRSHHEFRKSRIEEFRQVYDELVSVRASSHALLTQQEK